MRFLLVNQKTRTFDGQSRIYRSFVRVLPE